MHKIAVIKGDGIGEEVVNISLDIVKNILKNLNIKIEFIEYPFSADYYLKTGITIDNNFVTSLKNKYSAVFIGALGDPRVPNNIHAEEILIGLRKHLNLTINYRPVYLENKNYSPLNNLNGKLDITVFRENIEGEYSFSGTSFFENTDMHMVIENSVHTQRNIEKVIYSAFEHASNNYKKLTLVNKSNALKLSGILWENIFKKISKKFPNVETNHRYIDAACAELIKNPNNYDVIVCSNLFGDIISDITASLAGGLGVAPSRNYNKDETHFLGLYEPVHGSAPDIKRKNIANPIAALLSMKLLMNDLNYPEVSIILQKCVNYILTKNYVTPDLGGSFTSSEVHSRIIQYLKENNYA